MNGYGTCESCGARVAWCVSELRPSSKDPETMVGGHTMPVDPVPVDDGNLIKLGRNEHGTRIMRVLRKSDRAEIEMMVPHEQPQLFKSHHATCPHAAQHRNR
jgi:hypothetical protein